MSGTQLVCAARRRNSCIEEACGAGQQLRNRRESRSRCNWRGSIWADSVQFRDLILHFAALQRLFRRATADLLHVGDDKALGLSFGVLSLAQMTSASDDDVMLSRPGLGCITGFPA